ncbi:thiol reductant ABC exporter subunit CydD [Diaminobutyricibacter sp. McL0618]|uniref:thiol reductant ABC exporter subunit CydD n=1 Tax=Leifsonia sp. McL0618 TaxID=3415677 RepID=UPI003CE82470
MRPLDRRLLAYASAARATLALGAVIALAQTVCIVAFAWIVTQVIVRAIAGDGIRQLSGLLTALAIVIAVRGLLLWLADLTATRGGASSIGQLRAALLAAIARLGPSWLASRSTAEVTLTAGHGLDALDGYFTRYLPQLIMTAVATPLIVVVMLISDPTSGVIVIVTLPLIPLFMVLVGWATQTAQQRQWATLGRLSRAFLDVVNGLSTLKLFGRQHRQAERIRAISEEYRVRTMRVLRVSFLSGFVLELCASLSVAVVAVEVGLRLLSGDLTLGIGLFVLLLAPEAFLPVRNVGSRYHDATEGIAASEDAFAILDEDRAGVADISRRMPVLDPAFARGTVVFESVSIDYAGIGGVREITARFEPGSLTVLAGPSGAGKSSLLAALLGFTAYDGDIRLGGHEHPSRQRATNDFVSWAGQQPGLAAGTIAENVALGTDAYSEERVVTALATAAADELAPGTLLGVGGSGLSGGQAQRVAVARAIYRMLERDCPVLVLDEPTSALDDITEARVVEELRAVASGGRTVIVVSHRAAVIDAADAVVAVGELSHA